MVSTTSAGDKTYISSKRDEVRFGGIEAEVSVKFLFKRQLSLLLKKQNKRQVQCSETVKYWLFDSMVEYSYLKALKPQKR